MATLRDRALQALREAVVGDTIFGRYLLAEQIARGGMGLVFNGLDVSDSRPRLVTLKCPLPTLLASDPEYRARLLREAQMTAALGCVGPGFPVVLDQGEDPEVGPVMVMKHLGRGVTVRTLLDLTGRLNASEALRIARDTAHLLSMAHAMSFVHRDVSPDNVLVREDRSVIILDWGIAADLARPRPTMRSAIGKLAYMPPERSRGERGSAQTDVYSLGAMLVEMLTGVTLIVAGEFELSGIDIGAEAGDRLLELLRRSTCAKPESRGSMHELEAELSDLCDCLRGTQQPLRPITFAEMTQREDDGSPSKSSSEVSSGTNVDSNPSVSRVRGATVRSCRTECRESTSDSLAARWIALCQHGVLAVILAETVALALIAAVMLQKDSSRASAATKTAPPAPIQAASTGVQPEIREMCMIDGEHVCELEPADLYRREGMHARAELSVASRWPLRATWKIREEDRHCTIELRGREIVSANGACPQIRRVLIDFEADAALVLFEIAREGEWRKASVRLPRPEA